MPTYQYACTECGDQLEMVQKFSDDPLTECPACEGRLRKVFSPVGIVFKGSGFYRNDSRSGNGSAPKEKAGDSSSPSADAKAGSGPKSDGAKSDGAKSHGRTTAKNSSSPSPAARSSGSAGEKVA